MNKIRNILLVIDGKYHREALIAEATTVAKDSGAHVTLLSTLGTPPDNHVQSTESADLQQWIEDDHLDNMKDIAAELVKSGVQVTTKHCNGKPYLEIIREALRGDYDLIMKPAESGTTAKSILFGSTDMQLFRMSPTPIWAFKPTSNTELRKIMVAVDLLPDDQEKSDLADRVLQWGKHVAGLVGAKLDVVHIWDLYGETTLRGKSVSAYTVDKLVSQEKQKHQQWLNEALAKNGLEQEKVRIHFHKGEANKLIPEIANTMDTDLLVIGTVGRTGIPGFFIGNTADSVLRQIDCSVLAIKPEGFLTPVKLD